MLKKIYFGVGIGVILIYVASSLVGFEAKAPKAARSLGIMKMTRTKPAPASTSDGTTYPSGGPYPSSRSPRGGK
jgi:hypothetical protein